MKGTDPRATIYLLGFLFAITLVPATARAQILKVKKNIATDDSSNYFSGQLALAFSLSNRNSTADEQIYFTMFKTAGDVAYTSEKHVYLLFGDVRYSQSTGGPLLSTAYAHARANFLRKKRLSYELFAQTQYDQGRNLDVRLLGGGGLRFRILEKLALGVGIMQEQELWSRINAEETIFKDLTKLTSYLTGSVKFSPPISLSVTTYFQTGYDTASEVWRNRVSLDTALDIDLGKKLAFRVGYGMMYEDRPIIEISKTVFSLTNGLKYTM